jgi:hypothetical protein
MNASIRSKGRVEVDGSASLSTNSKTMTTKLGLSGTFSKCLGYWLMSRIKPNQKRVSLIRARHGISQRTKILMKSRTLPTYQREVTTSLTKSSSIRNHLRNQTLNSTSTKLELQSKRKRSLLSNTNLLRFSSLRQCSKPKGR